MTESSLPDLIGQLCDLHLGPVQRAYRVQPRVSRTQAKNHLKKLAYNTLFSFRKNELSDQKAWKDVEGILLEVFKMRLKRKFEDADQLESLYNKLREGHNQASLQFLKLLVALKNKDLGGGSAAEDDGCHFLKFREINRKAHAPRIGPVCYGETTSFNVCSLSFMHFPREVFEKPFSAIMTAGHRTLSTAFMLEPGAGLAPDQIFTNKTNNSSLFGGLVQGRVTGLDAQLTLPDISCDFNLRIPELTQRSPTSSRMSDESGLGSGTISMSSSAITLHESSGYDMTPLWEKALVEPRSNYYTWEWIGYLPGPTEKPHLTDAGPATFDVLVLLRRRILAIMCQQPQAPPLVMVSVDTLITYIKLMLTGTSSRLFFFNQESQSFSVVDGLHISGISPEMLASFLQEFLECGTLFSRLERFSRPPVLNSFYTRGLIFQAFTVAVRKFVNHFTAAVLKMPSDLSLLGMSVYMLKAIEQMRYLARLCRCHQHPPPNEQDFPMGMKLLAYLYDEAEGSSSSVHYPLLLSILQTCYAPFMLFIRDWIFHGVYRDFYEEFMVQVDLGCAESRDETYWSRAYTLNLETDRESIPHFLRDSIHEIVTCGKSINLLRLCQPQHFICNVSESSIPSISITFSCEDLKMKEKSCQTYIGMMRQMARQRADDRQELLRRVEQERVELQQIARRVTDMEMERLQGIIDERRKKAEVKKRAEFVRLKEQMETDVMRRAEDKVKAREEERQFIDRINREENALTEKEMELEKKARDELIAHYAELGEEALHRERLALWRVRRAKLGHARQLFLEQDVKRWRQELDEYLQAQSLLNSGSDSVPSWATRTAGIITVSGERDSSWVKQRSLAGTDNDDAESDAVKTAPPKWAERGLNQSHTETLQVGDDGVDLDELDSCVERGEVTHGERDDDDPDRATSAQTADIRPRSESDTSSNVDQSLHIIMHASSADNSSRCGRDTLDDTAIYAGCTNRQPGSHAEDVVKMVSDNLGNKHGTQKVGKITGTNLATESMTARSVIRMVQGMSACTESEEHKPVRHTKGSTTMTATTESEPETTIKHHVRFIHGKQVNTECSREMDVIPKLGRNFSTQTISSETKPEIWTIKKPSLFGHVSQLSNTDYILTLPRLRRQSQQHANIESSFKDFSIKPRIRISKTMSASQESEAHPIRPGIRISKTMSANQESETEVKTTRTVIRVFSHANSESEQVDEHMAAIQRFRSRNVWGHSSDSTVQRLLYGDSRTEQDNDITDGPLPRIEILPGLAYEAEKYQTEFPELEDDPQLDLMASIHVADLGRDLVDITETSQEEVETSKFMPLSVLLARSVTLPIRAQTSLVNDALINYFTSELKVDRHFEAIRRYLLMGDGDFAEIFANILLEKMSTNPLPQEVLNPVFLNGALNKAIQSSIYSDDQHAQNLSFALKRMPTVFLPNAPNSMDCLELRYNVSWPLNIILTSSCMDKYHKIFTFLLQIKRVVWTLKDIWHRLKRDALINKVGQVAQFRQLQLHRQEMEHFVKMMQGYITNQVIHVSWQEFQTALNQPVADLDQLHVLHQTYINKVISRCLLDKKAEKVMKFIQDIFCLILKFRSQLVSDVWQQRPDPKDGGITHPNFSNMVKTYQSFHVYSFFLFKVVNRLSQKGYQPHLQELLLQLNFNGYYTEAAS